MASIARSSGRAPETGGASEGSLALLLGGVVVMVFGVAAGLLLRRARE